MKILSKTIPEMSIDAFADRHGLVMEVSERPSDLAALHGRYSAHFASCEVMGNGMLSSLFGNGATPRQAIDDYAQQISETRICIGAYSNRRREIDVPRLTNK